MNSVELEKQRVSIDEYNKKFYELKKSKDQNQNQRRLVFQNIFLIYINLLGK